MENMGYDLESNEYEDFMNYVPTNSKLLLPLDLYMRISKSKFGFSQKYLKKKKQLKESFILKAGEAADLLRTILVLLAHSCSQQPSWAANYHLLLPLQSISSGLQKPLHSYTCTCT
jgi:hypothetical protein